MDQLPRWGRRLFAASAAALGAQHLLLLNFAPGLEQVSEGMPLRTAVAVVYGLALLIGGVSLLFDLRPRLGADLLLLSFFSFFLLAQLPPLVYFITNGSTWTRTFESLAMVAAAAAMAGPHWKGAVARGAVVAARVAFGLSLIVFGALHFIYLEFVATLVPAWIPARLFWAGFVGACFLAAGCALVTGIKARLAALWTGVMFAGFILLLHIPLVVTNARSPGQWTSMLVALLMWGGAWIVAGGEEVQRSELR
jgi:uncharacterized membrane protein